VALVFTTEIINEPSASEKPVMNQGLKTGDAAEIV